MQPTLRPSLLPLLACGLAAALAAQAIATRDLAILVGRGELLQFNADIVRLAIAEPKVADAVVVSPREVMVNAKAPGYTSVVVWETNAAPVRYNIRVTPDETTFETVTQTVRDALPGSDIKLSGNAETIVITGNAKTEDESKRAAGLAATHAKNVINLIKLPDPPAPRQIMLKVKFAAVDRVALTEYGLNFFSRRPDLIGITSTQQFAAPRVSQFQFQNNEFSNTSLNFSDLLNLFLYNPKLNVGATIRALQSRNLLQILAEPNLITLDGKEASFLAGGQFPFPVLTSTPTGGAVAPVVTVQFKNFGIQLNFTPTVLKDETIRLKVSPEVSSLDFSNSITLQGFNIPAISTRTASTEVDLKDGETFAIAGLLDSRVIQLANRVPWLGNVPILNYLFKSRSTKKTQDELLVVITPEFVKPLPRDVQAQLPTSIEPFLQTADEELAAKKKKGARKGAPAKPSYAGPTGHQEPPPGGPGAK